MDILKIKKKSIDGISEVFRLCRQFGMIDEPEFGYNRVVVMYNCVFILQRD